MRPSTVKLGQLRLGLFAFVAILAFSNSASASPRDDVLEAPRRFGSSGLPTGEAGTGATNERYAEGAPAAVVPSSDPPSSASVAGSFADLIQRAETLPRDEETQRLEAMSFAPTAFGIATTAEVGSQDAWPVNARRAARLMLDLAQQGVAVPDEVDITVLRARYGAPTGTATAVVPAKCGDEARQISIEIWDWDLPEPPSDSQFAWHEKAAGCKVAPAVMDSFRQLKALSDDVSVSFKEMVTYSVLGSLDADKLRGEIAALRDRPLETNFHHVLSKSKFLAVVLEDPSGAFSVGRAHLFGEGTRPDLDEAVRWFGKVEPLHLASISDPDRDFVLATLAEACVGETRCVAIDPLIRGIARGNPAVVDVGLVCGADQRIVQTDLSTLETAGARPTLATIAAHVESAHGPQCRLSDVTQALLVDYLDVYDSAAHFAAMSAGMSYELKPGMFQTAINDALAGASGGANAMMLSMGLLQYRNPELVSEGAANDLAALARNGHLGAGLMLSSAARQRLTWFDQVQEFETFVRIKTRYGGGDVAEDFDRIRTQFREWALNAGMVQYLQLSAYDGSTTYIEMKRNYDASCGRLLRTDGDAIDYTAPNGARLSYLPDIDDATLVLVRDQCSRDLHPYSVEGEWIRTDRLPLLTVTKFLRDGSNISIGCSKQNGQTMWLVMSDFNPAGTALSLSGNATDGFRVENLGLEIGDRIHRNFITLSDRVDAPMRLLTTDRDVVSAIAAGEEVRIVTDAGAVLARHSLAGSRSAADSLQDMCR